MARFRPEFGSNVCGSLSPNHSNEPNLLSICTNSNESLFPAEAILAGDYPDAILGILAPFLVDTISGKDRGHDLSRGLCRDLV